MLQRLPKLDLIAVRVHNVYELAVRYHLHLIADGYSGSFKLFHKGFQVFHGVVYHELLLRWLKILGIGFKGAPLGKAFFFRVIGMQPLEAGAVVIGIQAEMFAVPFFNLLRVLAFEEYAAYACNFFHWFVVGVLIMVPGLNI